MRIRIEASLAWNYYLQVRRWTNAEEQTTTTWSTARNRRYKPNERDHLDRGGSLRPKKYRKGPKTNTQIEELDNNTSDIDTGLGATA